MTNTNQKLLNASQTFAQKTDKILSQKFHIQVETVCDAVAHNIHKVVPGFQISDKFLWAAVLSVKQEVIPHLNIELQDTWKIIEDFLYECVGKDVEAHYKSLEEIQKELDDFALKHNLQTKFGLKPLHHGILSSIYKTNHTDFMYGDESGLGETSSVNIPSPTTYGNLWIAAEQLYKNSQDFQSKVITNFINKADGLMVIFDTEH